MEITFIRHAEKEETGEDPFLTKKGVKQAEHLAKRLTKDKFLFDNLAMPKDHGINHS